MSGETRVHPDPLVVKRQNDLFDLWTAFAAEHPNDSGYDPDDDPVFVAQSRQIMGLPPLVDSLVTKAAKGIVAAGLAVRAADTGRVLMLQRALSDDPEDDPAGGMFEFPGGKLEDGEKPKHAARREWAEETGCDIPDGKITGQWTSGNGVYRGYVLTVGSEDDVDIHDGRDQVTNPDDPDGDELESILWMDPAHLHDNPALRTELADNLGVVLPLLPPPKANKLFHVDPSALAYLHTLFDDDGVERFEDAINKVEEGAVGRFRARHLIRWYERGEGAARIAWGTPGDFDRCVVIAGEHMTPERAKGFCNLRHHGALGIYPATHAAMERGKKGANVDVEKAVWDPSRHPRLPAHGPGGGRFRSIAAAIDHALELHGKGEGHPEPLHGVERRHLLDAARRHGVHVRRNSSNEHVSQSLLDSVVATSPKIEDTTHGDRLANLERLSEETPSDIRQLGGGYSAYVDLLTFPDGQTAIRKVYGVRVKGKPSETKHEVDAEVLGSRVLDALGVRAPATVVTKPGTLLMEHLDGMTWSESHPYELIPSTIGDSIDGRRMGLADLVMLNTDRNSGNWMDLGNGRLAGIDHGASFPEDGRSSLQRAIQLLDFKPFGQFAIEYTSNQDQVNLRDVIDIGDIDLVEVRRELESLKPEFTKLGRSSWHKGMMSRLAEIERRATR